MTKLMLLVSVIEPIDYESLGLSPVVAHLMEDEAEMTLCMLKKRAGIMYNPHDIFAGFHDINTWCNQEVRWLRRGIKSIS